MTAILYGATGFTGSAIYLLFTIFFVKIGKQAPVISSALGYGCAFSFSFFVNYYFVFNSHKSLTKAALRFGIVSLIGFSLTTLIMLITTELFNLTYTFGLILVLIIIPVSNFILNLKWAFGSDAIKNPQIESQEVRN